MNYCTVGDHYHKDREHVIKSGPWAGHGACPGCFILQSSRASILDARAREVRKAAIRERLKALRCPTCKKPWRLCEDPTEHKKPAVGTQLSLPGGGS